MAADKAVGRTSGRADGQTGRKGHGRSGGRGHIGCKQSSKRADERKEARTGPRRCGRGPTRADGRTSGLGGQGLHCADGRSGGRADWGGRAY